MRIPAALLMTLTAIALPCAAQHPVRSDSFVASDGVRIHAALVAPLDRNDAAALAALDALARIAPQLAVTIIPGADHALAMSHPRRAAAIREFARRH
jgi:hypothetical protein